MRRFAVCSFFVTFLSLCPAAEPGVGSARPDNGASSATRPEAAGDRLLQPQDLIRVEVFQEKDLERQVRISQEYTITLPLIQRVDLKNKTIRQAEELIRKLYDADYLVNPQINITVLEYAPRSVNVGGAVNTAGSIAFPKEEGLTLLQAISRAGGFSRLANKKKVILTRMSAEGKPISYEIDADALEKGITSEPWPLQPDDVITVREKLL